MEPTAEILAMAPADYSLLCLVVLAAAAEYLFNLLFSGDTQAQSGFCCICIAWAGYQRYFDFTSAGYSRSRYALVCNADYRIAGYVLCGQQNPYLYEKITEYAFSGRKELSFMNQIITIGREFGSGGRELGRLLAEKLKIAYYDQEIIIKISKRTSLAEGYVQHLVEQVPAFPIATHVGRSFYPTINPVFEQRAAIYVEQHKLLQEFSQKSSCVIGGQMCRLYFEG